MAAFSYRTGFFITSLALAASLVLPATSRRDERNEPQRNATPAATSSATAATACTTELAACRAASWNAVASAINADLDDRARPARSSPATETGNTAAEPTPTATDYASQQRVLCDVAEQQAREHWVNHKAGILASIKDIGKDSWVRSERKKSLDKLSQKLGANGGEIRRFDQGYDTVWAKYGPIFQSQIAALPVNTSALVDSVRAYWRDEDQLVESVMGAHAREDYRVSELRSRTAIIAILAALSEKPFDESLTW